MVHVEFRQKFDSLVRLKDLQKFSKLGGLLEKMQTLKQSRLSVSKVTRKEWEFIMSLADVETKPNENENEITRARSATDNANPATDGGNENPGDVHPNGVLPDSEPERDVVGDEEININGQPAAKDEDVESGVRAQEADKNVGKDSRKSRR